MAEAPYLEALREYVTGGVLPFHTPGHHQGRGAPANLVELLGKAALQADITQVLGMDDIHRPHSVTARAQELAAEAYGVDATYFLVNGSTSGNHAMLLAALKPGDSVLVPRNAHRSVVAGLVLADARPVWYLPPFDPELGIFHAPEPSFLDDHPEARALLISSPTYYGAAADVDELVQRAHARGLVVLADEAWGAHLAFHPDLPRSAVAAGADLTVHSTHKVLSGLTQASMLHLRGRRIERGRLEAAVRMLQSTSPSCLLLASLDAARLQMVTEGRRLLDRLLTLATGARERLGEVYQPPRLDPTRIAFRVPGYTGYEVERELRERANLQIEMADRRLAVVQLTVGHTPEEVDRLVAAVRSLPARPPRPERRTRFILPPQILTPRQAFDADREAIPLENSRGRISAETVGVYPPGIPLVCAGEEITPEVLAELVAEREAGASLQGGRDPYLRVIDVVTSA